MTRIQNPEINFENKIYTADELEEEISNAIESHIEKYGTKEAWFDAYDTNNDMGFDQDELITVLEDAGFRNNVRVYAPGSTILSKGIDPKFLAKQMIKENDKKNGNNDGILQPHELAPSEGEDR